MKKIIYSLLVIASSITIAYAQVGQKWTSNGNVASIGDFLGTTNNEPLLLKSNNNLVLRLKPNGELMIKSLDLNSSAPSGLVLTSGQGVISRLDFNTSPDHVLFSNGIWGAIPTATVLNALKVNNLAGIGTRLLQVDANGNIMQLPQGTANQYLSGNGAWANVPNTPAVTWVETNGNLSYTHGYVGINTATPLFQLDVIGDARVSNNLYVGGGIVITDRVKATTEIKGWDFKVENDLDVEAGARLKGNTIIDKGFTFDGINGIARLVTGNNQTFVYGTTTSPHAPFAVGCAAAPTSIFSHNFNGNLQIYDQASAGTGATVMNLQTWTGGSSIDASTDGNTTGSNLLLNYFCGNNVGICTGQYGGTVSMGKIVEIGMPYPNDNTVALNIKAHQVNGIQIMDINNNINFKVKNNGFVYAREINVMPVNISFPDYVFDKNYKLLTLKEVENYISKNKHLPNIPSAKEVETDGINVADMQVKQMEKIEELFLYLIELKKENEALKNRIVNLETK